MYTKEIKYKKNKLFLKCFMLSLCTICSAGMLISCAGSNEKNKSSISNGVDIPIINNNSSSNEETSDIYTDNLFKAVVLEVNINEKTMVLQKSSSDNRVLYSYTGGTNILNKHGEIMSASQISNGDVVEIKVSGNTGKITDIKIFAGGFDYPGVTGFSIDTDKKMITVGSEKYLYTDNTIFISEDKIISDDYLEGIDVVTLKGKDKMLESVIVTSGHGYLRLDTTKFFEGGYIEIGEKIVESITENMVLPVPVGTYTVTVTKDKTSGTKEIVVNSNEEQRLNLIEFQSEAVRLGTLSFKINPSGAKLTIDGVKKDYSQIIDLAFGTHKIVVTADGYEPFAELITVEDIFKEYSISLTVDEDYTGEEESETSADDDDADKNANKDDKDKDKDTDNNKVNSDKTDKETTAKKTEKETEKETTTAQTIDFSEIIGSILG